MKPANFLDIGGGASAEVMANGLEIILGRPGGASRSSSTSSAASPPATRWPTASCRPSRCSASAATTISKPLVVRLDGNNAEEGRRILTEAAHPLRRAGRHHGRRRAPRRRARRSAVEGRAPTWRSGSTEDSQDHRPGHDRLRGHQAHPADARLRHARSSAASTPRKAGTSTSTASRCSAPSPRRWRRPAPTCPSSSCRRAFTKDAVIEAIDAAIPLVVVITEGVPVHDTADVLRSYAPNGGTTRIIGPNCPGLISPGKSNAGIIPADITQAGPDRAGLASRAR